MNQDQIVKCKGKESYIYKIRWWYVELIAGINWLASASKVLITSFNFICQWLLFGFCLCVSEETLICALSEMTGPLLCLGLQLQGQHCWLLPGGLCHPSAPTAREFSLLWFCHLTVWIREQRTQAERNQAAWESGSTGFWQIISFITSAQGEGWKKYSCVSISPVALYTKMLHCFAFPSYTS